MRKIKNKIIVSHVICIIIVSVIVGGITIYENYLMAKSEMNNSVKAVAEISQTKIDKSILSAQTITTGLKFTTLAFMNEESEEGNYNYLNKLSEIIKNVSEKNVFVSDMYVMISPKLSDYSQEGYFISLNNNVSLDKNYKIYTNYFSYFEKNREALGYWTKPYYKIFR